MGGHNSMHNPYEKQGKLFQLLMPILLFLVAGSLMGQTSQGVISGTITDSSGSVVQGVTVTIINEGNQVSRRFQANGQGSFNAQGIQPGTYTVTATAAGFEQNITSGIGVGPGQSREVDIRLQVGNVSSRVTVKADALQLQTQTSESRSP